MGNSQQMLGVGGTVTIGPLAFQVTPLSVRDENMLLARLRKLAKEAMGPGSYYANAMPVLEWMAKAKQYADRAAILAEVAKLVATAAPVTDEAAYDFRATPQGVAEEMFWRTRSTHPHATTEEFRAIITDVNAADVHHQLLEALTSDPKESGTTRCESPSGSSAKT